MLHRMLMLEARINEKGVFSGLRHALLPGKSKKHDWGVHNSIDNAGTEARSKFFDDWKNRDSNWDAGDENSYAPKDARTPKTIANHYLPNDPNARFSDARWHGREKIKNAVSRAGERQGRGWLRNFGSRFKYGMAGDLDNAGHDPIGKIVRDTEQAQDAENEDFKNKEREANWSEKSGGRRSRDRNAFNEQRKYPNLRGLLSEGPSDSEKATIKAQHAAVEKAVNSGKKSSYIENLRKSHKKHIIDRYRF